MTTTAPNVAPAPGTEDMVPREVAESWRSRAENLAEERAALLDDIAMMMSKHVENWPEPKSIHTAIALIDKTLTASVADNAELVAMLVDLLPGKLCGESWDMPDDETVHITVTFGKIKRARALASKAALPSPPASAEGEV